MTVAPSVVTGLCVAGTIALTVTGQAMQKQLAMDAHGQTSTGKLHYYLGRPLFWGAIASLAVAMLVWLVVLSRLPVSKAYPLLSANYVVMLVVARGWFRERVPPARWLGAGLIVAGVAAVSLS